MVSLPVFHVVSSCFFHDTNTKDITEDKTKSCLARLEKEVFCDFDVCTTLGE
jgi:hypothetical protein